MSTGKAEQDQQPAQFKTFDEAYQHPEVKRFIDSLPDPLLPKITCPRCGRTIEHDCGAGR